MRNTTMGRERAAAPRCQCAVEAQKRRVALSAAGSRPALNRHLTALRQPCTDPYAGALSWDLPPRPPHALLRAPLVPCHPAPTKQLSHPFALARPCERLLAGRSLVRRCCPTDAAGMATREAGSTLR